MKDSDPKKQLEQDLINYFKGARLFGEVATGVTFFPLFMTTVAKLAHIDYANALTNNEVLANGWIGLTSVAFAACNDLILRYLESHKEPRI